MFAVIGILVVFGAVIGGFLMEKGHIEVLIQPAELLIIVGASTGTLLVANPSHILKGIVAGLKGVLGGSKFNKERYLNALKMMYQFLNKVRKEGLLSVEMDVEKPKESAIFKNFPDFLNDHHACDFVCDTLRMAITGGVEPFDMDQMMELDMEVHHRDAIQPVNALSTMADALPGLGIVAAVLGVVITMGALGGPPEEIGHKVAAALVGTFLGILLCYGVAGPLSSNMNKTADDHNSYLQVLRVLLLSFLKGSAPMIAIEMGRRDSGACAPKFRRNGKALQESASGGTAGRSLTEYRAMPVKTQPIIVIKKKGSHAGHHGGAWKVAYADFVTAMMSLFIVLWLMNSSEKIKKAVAGYFNDPRGTASLMGTTLTGTGETVSAAAADNMQSLKDKLEHEIKANKELENLSKQIKITITPEGLRIELLEDKNGTFYEIGSAKLSLNGQELLSLLASELKTLPNSLLIEGHTDATQYSIDASYSNWELSADRANSARRLLQQSGVRSDQVTQVRGYADQLLRVKDNPNDPSNRRVSILVKNQDGPLLSLKGAVASPEASVSPGAQQSAKAGVAKPKAGVSR